MSRHSRLLALAVLAAALLPGTAHASGAAAGTGALRICTNCAAAGGDLSRYRYVILNSWDAPLLPALKAANPGLKALVYKNLTFTMSYGCSGGVDLPYQTSGVGYCDASAHHPEWFLTDPSGDRLNSAQYPQAWVMDVGDSGYQSTWLSNVLADLRAGGWDGVFMDDTNADMGWHLAGRTIARYPTGSSWRAATRSMLASVGPALRSAGFLAIPNVYAPWAADYDAQATWSDWIQFTSGAAQEYYSKWGTGSSGWFAGNDWTYRQRFQSLTEDVGKIFLGITYAPKSDTRSMAWARANFLLFGAPSTNSALLFEPSDPEAQDPYSSAWTADLGTPVGARFQVGSAWRRNFSGGTVVVNPTSSSVTVPLGDTYLLDGAPTSSVTLGPTSGAVLTATITPPPPAPPPLPPPLSASLTATLSGTSVQLIWQGLSGDRVDVYRNGRRSATVSNSGAYSDKLPRGAKGTYTYKVCTAGGSTCTPAASVLVASGSTTAQRLLRKRIHASPSRGATHARRWLRR